MKYEISVRPVTRYVVAEYHEDYSEGSDRGSAGSQGCGEFSNKETAIEMARARGALRRSEGHEDVTVLDGDKMMWSTTANPNAEADGCSHITTRHLMPGAIIE